MLPRGLRCPPSAGCPWVARRRGPGGQGASTPVGASPAGAVLAPPACAAGWASGGCALHARVQWWACASRLDSCCAPQQAVQRKPLRSLHLHTPPSCRCSHTQPSVLTRRVGRAQRAWRAHMAADAPPPKALEAGSEHVAHCFDALIASLSSGNQPAPVPAFADALWCVVVSGEGQGRWGAQQAGRAVCRGSRAPSIRCAARQEAQWRGGRAAEDGRAHAHAQPPTPPLAAAHFLSPGTRRPAGRADSLACVAALARWRLGSCARRWASTR